MKRFASILLVVTLILAFVAGLGYLFALRFEQGDIYPTYSSLRADPMGLKVWFEALERLEQLTVERHLLPWSRSSSRAYADAVMVAAGQSPHQDFLGSEDCNALMDQVTAGGRWILALTTDPNSRVRSRPDPNHPSDPNLLNLRSWQQKIGLGWEQHQALNDPWPSAHPQGDLLDLDSTAMPWPGRLTLAPSDPNWQVLGTCQNNPVMVTRPWGQGSLVVLADSYLLSNEAQIRHRHPELLSYLIGPYTRVLFDETHLGISETGSLVALARRYRLGGLALGLAMTLILFLWSRAGQLNVETASPRRKSTCIQGKDLSQGLESLLQRHIPNRDLLSICIQEYLSTTPNLSPDKRKQIEAQLEQAQRSGLKDAQCVRLYQNTVKILEPIGHKGTL